MQQPSKRYVGVHKELNGGMTDTAKIIRDAWVFGLIPESETCEGWLAQDIESLWVKVDAEWEIYGFLVSRLPDELRQRFIHIQSEAFKKAKTGGWDPNSELLVGD